MLIVRVSKDEHWFESGNDRYGLVRNRKNRKWLDMLESMKKWTKRLVGI